MAGTFGYDLFQNRAIHLSAADLPIITAGLVVAFISAAVVVGYLLDYVSREGYALFDRWRLAAGGAGLAALLLWN